jgi:ATP-binding cassette subfamily F protein uup
MPIGQLSGGERARILIARLMLKPADILLLDEPTNDLDIPTLETLEESLEDFPGALVLITHDRYMIDQLSNVILGLGTGDENQYFADYTQWEEYLVRKTAAKEKTSQEKPKASPAPAAKKLSYLEKRELENMEKAILEAENAVEECQQKVGDPAIAHDAVKLQEVCQLLHKAQSNLEKLYRRWQELENKQTAS